MRILILSFFVLLAACTGKPSFDDPALSERQLHLEEFFDGQLVAYGQFQDVFGTVRRRFEVNIAGDWDGERLRLVEDFVYEDMSTEQRIWTLTKTGPRSWTGSAAGVTGMATGQEDGDRFNWQYAFDLPTGDSETMNVTFDDWMWLQTDDRLLNIAYIKRLGVDIGAVTISFEKIR